MSSPSPHDPASAAAHEHTHDIHPPMVKTKATGDSLNTKTYVPSGVCQDPMERWMNSVSPIRMLLPRPVLQLPKPSADADLSGDGINGRTDDGTPDGVTPRPTELLSHKTAASELSEHFLDAGTMTTGHQHQAQDDEGSASEENEVASMLTFVVQEQASAEVASASSFFEYEEVTSSSLSEGPSTSPQTLLKLSIHEEWMLEEGGRDQGGSELLLASAGIPGWDHDSEETCASIHSHSSDITNRPPIGPAPPMPTTDLVFDDLEEIAGMKKTVEASGRAIAEMTENVRLRVSRDVAATAPLPPTLVLGFDNSSTEVKQLASGDEASTAPCASSSCDAEIENDSRADQGIFDLVLVSRDTSDANSFSSSPDSLEGNVMELDTEKQDSGCCNVFIAWLIVWAVVVLSVHAYLPHQEKEQEAPSNYQAHPDENCPAVSQEMLLTDGGEDMLLTPELLAPACEYAFNMQTEEERMDAANMMAAVYFGSGIESSAKTSERVNEIVRVYDVNEKLEAVFLFFVFALFALGVLLM